MFVPLDKNIVLFQFRHIMFFALLFGIDMAFALPMQMDDFDPSVSTLEKTESPYTIKNLQPQTNKASINNNNTGTRSSIINTGVMPFFEQDFLVEQKKRAHPYRYGKRQTTDLFSMPANQTDNKEKDSVLSVLLEPLKNDPQFNEKARDVIHTIKDVKNLLGTQTESFNADEQQLSLRLIEQRLAQQQQELMLEQGEKQSSFAQEKYDPSLFKEFLSKVIHFALYALAGIVLLKLIFIFVSWQRKVNKF